MTCCEFLAKTDPPVVILMWWWWPGEACFRRNNGFTLTANSRNSHFKFTKLSLQIQETLVWNTVSKEQEKCWLEDINYTTNRPVVLRILHCITGGTSLSSLRGDGPLRERLTNRKVSRRQWMKAPKLRHKHKSWQDLDFCWGRSVMPNPGLRRQTIRENVNPRGENQPG